MSLASSGIFRAQHFQRMMAFLSQKGRETLSDWLVRIFYACQTPSIMIDNQKLAHKCQVLLEEANHSDVVSTFWGLWECARYCINTRLRTPFGGPMQTFEAIEKLLIAYASVTGASSTQPNASQPTMTKQYPLRMLLLFADHLEKQIYSTFEGCISIEYRPSKHSIAFFRANRKVCTDWYSRMRQPLVSASAICDSSADIIRHSMKRLLDLRLIAARFGRKD